MSPSFSPKNQLRTLLPWPLYWRLKRLREEMLTLLHPDTLTAFSNIYKTDKGWRHQYTPIYHSWLQKWRYQPVRLLEVGIGGNENPRLGGNSLRMWKRFFPNGMITGIDIFDKSQMRESRIQTFQGDQTDIDFLQKVHTAAGPFDIIIDDGSHMQSHVITTFETLFPCLRPGGLYVIEDTHTAYMPLFEGSTSDMLNVPSTMNYFASRVHQVNAPHWTGGDHPAGLHDEQIACIAFYQKLIFIQKRM